MPALLLRTRCFLHPATALVLWLFFVIWTEFAAPLWLVLAAIILLPGLPGDAWTLFVRYLRRTRWLLLSLLVIHAYTMPGELLFPGLGGLSPQLEGMQEGGLRISRILLLLAALALLMTHVSRTDLLLGIYRILQPLKWFNINGERIAVRLWLTLHYAEMAMGSMEKMSIHQRLEALKTAHVLPTVAISKIELIEPAMGWSNYLCLLLAVALAVISFA